MSEGSAAGESSDTVYNKKDRIINIISSVIEKVGKNEKVSLNSILTELRDLLIVIEETRQEIGSARTSDIKGKHIPGATDELDAIVESTSEATGTIMDACEVIQEKAMAIGTDDSKVILDESMKIFEACSFQDITGQRISKVVKTFHEIEEKIDKLVSVLGISVAHVAPEEDTRVGDEKLLNGPQTQDQAISQDDIDKLLAELDGASD